MIYTNYMLYVHINTAREGESAARGYNTTQLSEQNDVDKMKKKHEGVCMYNFLKEFFEIKSTIIIQGF